MSLGIISKITSTFIKDDKGYYAYCLLFLFIIAFLLGMCMERFLVNSPEIIRSPIEDVEIIEPIINGDDLNSIQG